MSLPGFRNYKNEFYFVDFIDVCTPANHSATEYEGLYVKFVSDSRVSTHP